MTPTNVIAVMTAENAQASTNDIIRVIENSFPAPRSPQTADAIRELRQALFVLQLAFVANGDPIDTERCRDIALASAKRVTALVH